MKKRYFLLLFLGLLFVVMFLYPVKIGLWLQRKNLEYQGLQKKSVETTAGTITYFEGGIGDTVFFLHDIFSEAGVWVQSAGNLVSGYHIVAMDLPGHGESTIVGHPGAEEIVDMIHIVAQKIPAGKFTLVGNSFGGWLAALYAYKHPEKVDKLVLVNSAGLKTFYPRSDWVAENNEEYASRLKKMYGESYSLPPGFVISKLLELQSPGQKLLFDALVEKNLYLDFRLPSLKIPVYVIWGRPDGLLDDNYKKKMFSFAVRTEILEGAGHSPQFLKPDLFANALRSILAEP